MDSAVVAAIGVGGTVVVGVTGFWAAVKNTSQTIASAEESRIWERRAQAYTEYGYAVKNLMALCLRIADYRGLGPGIIEKINLTKALSEVEELSTERTAKWESVLLLGDPDTVEAARKWHRQVGQMVHVARGQPTDRSEWDALQGNVIAARTAFYDAARRGLGVKSGDLPRAGRWELPLTPVSSGGSRRSRLSAPHTWSRRGKSPVTCWPQRPAADAAARGSVDDEPGHLRISRH